MGRVRTVQKTFGRVERFVGARGEFPGADSECLLGDIVVLLCLMSLFSLVIIELCLEVKVGRSDVLRGAGTALRRGG